MKHTLALCLTFAATTTSADVARAVDTYILPGYAGFADTASHLSDAAAQDCTPEAVRPAWNNA